MLFGTLFSGFTLWLMSGFTTVTTPTSTTYYWFGDRIDY